MLVVLVAARDSTGTFDENVTSVKFGGVDFTLADAQGITTGLLRNEIWYLNNPSVSTATIAVNWAATVQTGSAMAISLTGVNLTTPNFLVVETVGVGTSATGTISTGDIQLANVSSDTSTSLTNNAGTLIFNNDGSRQHAGVYNIGSSLSASMTVGASNDWAVQLLSIDEDTGGGGPPAANGNFLGYGFM